MRRKNTVLKMLYNSFQLFKNFDQKEKKIGVNFLLVSGVLRLICCAVCPEKNTFVRKNLALQKNICIVRRLSPTEHSFAIILNVFVVCAKINFVV